MTRVFRITTQLLHSPRTFKSSISTYKHFPSSRRYYLNPLDVFKKQKLIHSAPDKPDLPANKPIEEECHPSFNPAKAYFAYPGEVLAQRFEVLFKLGYEGKGTTWLVRDLDVWHWQPEACWAVKICESHKEQPSNDDDPETWTTIEHVWTKVSEAALQDPENFEMPPLHLPMTYIEIKSPKGMHDVYVSQPMRENLLDFRGIFEAKKLPMFLVKAYVKMLLQSLRFLHEECSVVHTDLKLTNIMVTYEDPTLIDEQVQSHLNNRPSCKRSRDGPPVFKSLNIFPAFRKPFETYILSACPLLADFGRADLQPPGMASIQPAQANHYRAPEILLGMPWSKPIDVWNLGVLLWDLVENRSLFEKMPIGIDDYDPALHLAYIVALLGKPGKDLIARVENHTAEGLEFKSPLNIMNFHTVKNARTPRELYGGPYFDGEGNFLRLELVPRDFRFEDSITSLEDEEKAEFLRFARRALTWDPLERASAAELLDDPWLRPD